MQLNHKLIPVRNIDLKFNLSETPHYVCLNGKKQLLENVYFSGLQEHFRKAHLILNGKVDVVGVCFLPESTFAIPGLISCLLDKTGGVKLRSRSEN